jgi:filamentous hemagglutinin family protein
VLALSARITSAQTIAPANDGTNTIVTPNGTQLDISGGTLSNSGANLFHSFQQFGLDPAQTANFLANPQIQNILGRVVGGNPSIIEGLIQVTGSNANLYLMNPAGLLFSATARLNVPGAFIATTATAIAVGNQWWPAFGPTNVANLDGVPDQFAFSGSQPGAIANAGNLAVGTGQDLLLLGGTVVNTGTLTAPSGQVSIVGVPGQTLVRVSQPGRLLNLEFAPLGPMATPALPFTPLTLPQLLTGGNQTSATGLTVNADGTVQLTRSGSRIPTEPGTAIASGNLTTTGPSGGRVKVLGTQVGVLNGAIAANGDTGGGTIRIGGDVQGQGTLPTANRTLVDRESVLNADALQTGNGGRVIVWADQTTSFLGQVHARGGAQLGNGGFVEISGQQNLRFAGTVDVTATAGTVGTILFDPRDINIVPGIGVDDAELLDNTILFDDGGLTTDFTISATTLSNLTGTILLQASRDINVTAPLSLFGGGDVTFIAGGNFNAVGQDIAVGGNLVISATNIAIANVQATNTALLATGDVTLTSPISTFGGNFNLTAGGNVNGVGQSITNAGGNVSLTAASITLGGIDTSQSGFSEGPSLGGNITLTSTTGAITTGALNTSALDGTVGGLGTLGAQAGNVTVTAARDITLSNINAQAGISFLGSGDAIAGAVTLTTTGAGAIRLTGTLTDLEGLEASIATIAQPGLFSGVATPGTIALTHGGGLTNDPFIVGDPGVNGSAGVLNAGSGSVVPLGTQFPVSPQGGLAPSPTPPRTTVSSVNTPPTLTATPVGLNTPVNQPLTIAATALGTVVTDGDTDNTTLTITAIAAGVTVRVNGTLAIPGVTVLTASDQLEITPPPNITGLVELFSLQASDRVSVSNPVTISLTVVAATPNPVWPSIPPCRINCAVPPPPRPPAPPLPSLLATSGLPLLNPVTPDDRFTGEYTAYLGVEPRPTPSLDEMQDIASRVERETGTRPAFVYLSFVPVGLETASAAPDATLELSEADPRRANDQLEIVIVTAQGTPIRKRIAVTRADVLALANQFRQDVADPRKVRGTAYLPEAQQLYHWFMAPVQAELQTRRITNLVMIVDVGLRSLPFAALHDGTRFLVEQYSLGLMPSLSLTDTRYEDVRQAQVLGLGISESTGNLSPLPAVTTEITNLSQLWRSQLLFNQEATLQNLTTTRSQTPYGIVHLATHANFETGALNNSFIQFWNQRLRLDQVQQLGLNNPQVQLLVLSACDTALGDREAELGFAGLAVKTGVKTAIASLWSVSDTATTSLMTRFYQDLRATPIKAEALRQAQLAFIRPNHTTPTADTPTAISKELSHPYFWAGFTVIGSPW